MIRRETLERFLEDAGPILRRHWEEIDSSLPFDPDYDVYREIESEDRLRLFALRQGKTLGGYALFFVETNPHSRHCRQALLDLLYVLPEFRGAGINLIRFAENYLEKEGFDLIQFQVKRESRAAKLLPFLGYDFTEEIHVKRLGDRL